jgi:hypothetical protein
MSNEKTPSTLDYFDEFMAALRADLERGEKKWGDTWLHRPRNGQEGRIKQYIVDHFDRFAHAGNPVRWESIAGEAFIGWIRENHPELFPDA